MLEFEFIFIRRDVSKRSKIIKYWCGVEKSKFFLYVVNGYIGIFGEKYSVFLRNEISIVIWFINVILGYILGEIEIVKWKDIWIFMFIYNL